MNFERDYDEKVVLVALYDRGEDKAPALDCFTVSIWKQNLEVARDIIGLAF